MFYEIWFKYADWIFSLVTGYTPLFAVDKFFRIRFRLTKSDYISCFVPFPFSLVVVNCLILFSFGIIWFRVTKFDNDIFLVIIISRVVYFIFSASYFFCTIRNRVPKSDCSPLQCFFFFYATIFFGIIWFCFAKSDCFSLLMLYGCFFVNYFFFLIPICLCSNISRFCVTKSDFLFQYFIYYQPWNSP